MLIADVLVWWAVELTVVVVKSLVSNSLDDANDGVESSSQLQCWHKSKMPVKEIEEKVTANT